MFDLARGRYRVRVARDAGDVLAAQRLRGRCFIPGGGIDSDDLDNIFTHVLVEDHLDGTLAGCFRLLPSADGTQIGRGYAARSYDLARLLDYDRPMAELGRVCVQPGRPAACIVRIAWGALAEFVDRAGVGMLFGCSSFTGTDPARYQAAFALLRDRHLAPLRWRPAPRAAEVVSFAALPPDPAPKGAADTLPPLLRTYLSMGGWVSDHAVIDRRLNTLHVFTAVEIAAIPAGRRQPLRPPTSGRLPRWRSGDKAAP